MTFCVGMKVKNGLVGIADTLVTSGSDVDFPIDVVIYQKDTYVVVEERYERQNLIHISQWWQDRIKSSVPEISSDWILNALSKIPKKNHV
jgi:putative proteasome-type protease